MRSSSHSPFAAVLVVIPLLAVPLLAVFGIPQLEPTAASPSATPAEDGFATDAADVGVGESIRYGADDLFAPIETESGEPANQPPLGAESVRRDTRPVTRLGSPLDRISAPRRTDTNRRDVVGAPSGRPNWSPPADALQGWALDADEASAASTNATSADPRQPPASPAPLTWQEAVRRLNELGIRRYQLQPGQRETDFQFSCSFTLPDYPRITHRFEAEADEPLKAVQDVLTQVENWHKRR